MTEKKLKLCYIIPEYSEKSPTHFAYLADFTKNISEKFFLKIISVRDGWIFWKIIAARLAGFKIFYVHYSFFAAFFASCLVKLTGGKVFYWNCGLPWKYKRNFLRECFERLAYRAIDFLVTGTEGLKRQYAGNYNISTSKILAMPNWINMSQIKIQRAKVKIEKMKTKLDILPGQRVVLFVHRLSKRKGAHYLPEIAKSLDGLNAKLIIAGDGPEWGNLEPWAKNYNLTPKPSLLGWVPQNEIGDYFSIADVFVMPSEEEGFPHVILEAMAYGVSFVAYDVGGVKEITPPATHEYIIPAGDIQQFSAALKNILNVPREDLDRLRQIELEWVKRYDINKVADIFYENIIRHQ